MYFLDEGREGRTGKAFQVERERGTKHRKDQTRLGNRQEFSRVGMQDIYKKEEEREAKRMSRGFNFLWSHTQAGAVAALLHAGNHGDGACVPCCGGLLEGRCSSLWLWMAWALSQIQLGL